MSWYKAGGINEKWKDNQGFINAMTVQIFYKKGREAVKEYASTLTDEQRFQARSHLVTVMKLRAKDEQRDNDKTSG